MNKTIIGISFVLVLAMACAGVFWAVLHSEDVRNMNQRTFISLVGQKAPNVAIKTDRGVEYNLSTSGRPLVLEVFATWCEYCQAEVPTLNALYRKYHGQVDFLAVTGAAKGMNDAVPESWGDIAQYAKKFKVLYPIAFDRAPHQVAKDYRASGYPDIAIIGADGIVAYHSVGEVRFGPLDVAVAGVAAKCSATSASCKGQ